MRKISWNGKPSKIDVRRWINTENGEMATKGVTLSDDACNELTVDLSKEGYGNTRAIIRAIKHRENFDEDLEQALKTDKDPEPEEKENNEEEIDETLYDPEDIFN